jgi:hypothetical protein
MPPRFRTFALALALASMAKLAHGETAPASRAGDYVGREATIEGRVVATYESPLATVLAFTPNFAGFTATILAGDRPKFPADLDRRYRGKVLQITGEVAAYRGKPEMTLHDPSQVTVVVDVSQTASPAPTPEVSATAAPPSAELDDLRRALLSIEDRLGALEGRLAGIEQVLATQTEQARAARAAQPTPVARVRGLGIGATAARVRAALGPPLEVHRGVNGGDVWFYGTGRTVTFGPDGRVVSWTGY